MVSTLISGSTVSHNRSLKVSEADKLMYKYYLGTLTPKVLTLNFSTNQTSWFPSKPIGSADIDDDLVSGVVRGVAGHAQYVVPLLAPPTHGPSKNIPDL
jgi:hypothetical protein